MIENIKQHEGINCTINTTENCNLRCKYCYEINKAEKTIDPEYCYKFIDLIFSEKSFQDLVNDHSLNLDDGIVIDFIGGDSLINPELLDKVLSYFNYKFITSDKFRGSGWRASISSNGTLFYRKDVRDFCEKWKDNLHIGVSIDGCPEIHDLNRVFPDGSGSMAKILEWWPWYQSVFPTASKTTKATCSRNTIPYLYDSLVFMHETLRIDYINQNFIMEDTGCTEEDYKELDRQLEKCCDYVLEHSHEIYWSMIDPQLFVPKNPKEDEDFYTKGRCGSGCMPTLSIDGRIYPCFRWLPHTQQSAGVMCVGDVNNGFYNKQNFSNVLMGALRCNCTKDPKCLECEYENACAYCIGGCYAEYGEFRRTTHICEITKLQAKWAQIYKQRFEEQRRKLYDSIK